MREAVSTPAEALVEQSVRAYRRAHRRYEKRHPEIFNDVEQACLEDGLSRSLADASFDMVAASSVLHHVPDYLAIVDEMQRVLRPGGVLYLDHEASEGFWEKDACVARFRAEVREDELTRPGFWNPARNRWQRFLVPRNYADRWRRWRDPAYPWNVEGDIHVWEWDHIEWPAIRERLEHGGSEVVFEGDYLHYSSGYPRNLWERYAAHCADTRLLVARRMA